jgi:hypothetical protein
MKNMHTPAHSPSMKSSKKSTSARVPYSKRNVIRTPANVPRRKA